MEKIVCEDCLVGMKKIPDNRVDLIATDPPYGMSFMNKDWDKAVPSVNIWKECLRVLKPGAFAFIICIPRQDCLARMITNLSDSGFNTNFTSIYWTYACVSDDTEILTEDGFKNIDEITLNKKVCSLNIKKNKLIYSKPINKYVYDYDGKLINIQNKNTNQLITPNHKVLLKTKSNSRYDYGNYKYIVASSLLNGKKFPYYQFPLAKRYYGTLSIGIDFAELLGWIISDGHFYKQSNGPNAWDIRIYQSDVNKDKVDRIRYLLNSINIKHSEYKRKRKYKDRYYVEHCFYVNGDIKEKIKKYIPDKKPSKILLQLVREESQALFNGLIGGDGSVIKGNKNPDSYCFYQKDRYTRDFVQILSMHLGYRTSTNEKKYAVYIGWRNTTEIQKRDKKIKEVDYSGRVWCVETNYGNFVARRNGKVFITGNSGFPKAGNIGKLVDKRLGVKREIVGKSLKASRIADGNLGKQSRETDHAWTKGKSKDIHYDVTVSSSPEAKSLDGSFSGFQPKPAVEVIIVAMKPLSEKTYLDQAMKNKKGVTWFDDCRIPFKSEKDKESSRFGTQTDIKGNAYGTNRPSEGHVLAKNVLSSQKGRFPANLLVSDGVLRTGKIAVYKESKPYIATKSNQNWHSGEPKSRESYAGYGDSGSFSRYFDLDAWWKKQFEKLPEDVQKTFPFLIVPKASKSEKNKGCEKLPEKPIPYSEYRENYDTTKSYVTEYPDGKRRPMNKPRNFHPTVKPIKLMSYLITLGSRKGDLILDPFMGSGTTAISSRLLNRHFLGFEINQEYINIAEARLSAYPKQKLLGE